MSKTPVESIRGIVVHRLPIWEEIPRSFGGSVLSGPHFDCAGSQVVRQPSSEKPEDKAPLAVVATTGCGDVIYSKSDRVRTMSSFPAK